MVRIAVLPNDEPSLIERIQGLFPVFPMAVGVMKSPQVLIHDESYVVVIPVLRDAVCDSQLRSSITVYEQKMAELEAQEPILRERIVADLDAMELVQIGYSLRVNEIAAQMIEQVLEQLRVEKIARVVRGEWRINNEDPDYEMIFGKFDEATATAARLGQEIENAAKLRFEQAVGFCAQLADGRTVSKKNLRTVFEKAFPSLDFDVAFRQYEINALMAEIPHDKTVEIATLNGTLGDYGEAVLAKLGQVDGEVSGQKLFMAMNEVSAGIEMLRTLVKFINLPPADPEPKDDPMDALVLEIPENAEASLALLRTLMQGASFVKEQDVYIALGQVETGAIDNVRKVNARQAFTIMRVHGADENLLRELVKSVNTPILPVIEEEAPPPPAASPTINTFALVEALREAQVPQEGIEQIFSSLGVDIPTSPEVAHELDLAYVLGVVDDAGYDGAHGIISLAANKPEIVKAE